MSAPSARARAFRHATHAVVCDRIEPWEHGTAVYATRYPTFRAYNCVRVEDAAEDLDADALLAALDRLQGGLDHRCVEVEDAAAGARLRPAFEAMGWQTERLVWMELEGLTTGGPAPLEVGEVAYKRVRPLRTAWYAEEPASDEEEIDEFFDVVQEVAALRGVRGLLAWDGGGEPVGYASFSIAGDAAEVEEVWVDPGHRGGGIGGALVAAAVAAAGRPRTWIVADDEGAPKRLYTRLGFRPAWIQHVFVRLPYSVSRPPA